MQVGYGQLTSQVLITVGSFAGWGVKLSGQSLQIAGGGGDIPTPGRWKLPLGQIFQQTER